ncbi:efflux transporter outer membrane subunit [Croceicoccus sp. Ery15]|uniref:efflux transporter outer membrane subunit n=1 Tax=Croceicoccus sp. Ery15 TaxID=1703338 RepID=UPI001E39AE90|nr:efflux transporter outer membrane subunit [Croceicoccus sp. Ery15]
MSMRHTAPLAAIAMVLVLPGCINMAPDHVTPELSTAPAFDPEYGPDGTVVATSLSYRDWFADPRLDALIGAALRNNRDLVAATARIEQARAQYRIQDSRRLPSVVASADATRTRTPLTGAIAGASGDTSAITVDNFQVGVGVSAFELDFWGRVRNLSDASRAQYLSSVAAQRAFYLSLIADVATTYYELLETQDQVELAIATVSSRSDSLIIAKRRLDIGVTSALPMRQAETLLTAAQQQLASQRLAEAQLRNQLAVLVGGRIPDDLPEGLALEEQGNGMRLDPGLPSEMLLARPDVVAAEENLRAARANIGAARAAFFPTISLTGNAGFASETLGGLFDEGIFAWSAGPSISLPIFDWGAREGDLDYAKALEVEEVANYDMAVQTAFREVSDALAGRRWLTEQVAVLERTVAAQEEIDRISTLRYREGVTDYLEVLDAERSLFSAQQDLITTRRALLQNGATLYVALGGGFEVNGSEIEGAGGTPVDD